MTLPPADELTLVTRGRKTGREHRVRLWFAQEGDVLWLRTDELMPDWYRNLLADRRCQVIVGSLKADARLEQGSEDVNADLRRLVELWRAKYGAEWVQDWYVEKGRVPVRIRLQ